MLLSSHPGTPVTVLNGPILALDADQGSNAVVTYQLLKASLNLFIINNKTGGVAQLVCPQPRATRSPCGLPPAFSPSPGVVSVKPGGAIDREALLDPHLEFTLVACDVGGLNSTASLAVTILDDNDNRPVFQPASITARLLENSPPGQDWM